MVYRSLIFSFFILLTFTSLGSACCGSGASSANLILGDFESKYSLSYANSVVTNFATSDGRVGIVDSYNKITETLSFETTQRIEEFYQLGVTIPVVKKTYDSDNDSETSNTLGDLKLMLGYEILPELGYSPWKPRGYIYITQSFPTGKSQNNSKKMFKTDASGRGFYITSIGSTFFKVKGNHDFITSLEYHNGLKRSFKINNEIRDISPGYGYSASLQYGRSLNLYNIRFGVGATYSFEEGSSDQFKTQDSSKYYLESLLSLSSFINNYSMSLNYRDQAFFGVSKNLQLSKAISLSMTKYIDP